MSDKTDTEKRSPSDPSEVKRQLLRMGNAVREFCASKAEIWQKIPHLALAAYGRGESAYNIDFCEACRVAFRYGVWTFYLPHSQVIIDCDTGSIVFEEIHNTYSYATDEEAAYYYFEFSKELSDDQNPLFFEPEKIVAELEALAKQPFPNDPAGDEAQQDLEELLEEMRKKPGNYYVTRKKPDTKA